MTEDLKTQDIEVILKEETHTITNIQKKECLQIRPT